jgi:hypothetical protein
VVAPAPWLVHLWLVDADCALYDSTSPTTSNQHTSVFVPPDDAEQSIATLQQFSPPATALLTDLTEARPLIRTKLTVKTLDSGHHITGLVDCAATLDFVFEDFVRRFALQTRKSVTKTHVRLANGQRVTSSTVCDVTFELARHEYHRTFYVLRDLRAADLIMGLPWLDDEHAFFTVWFNPSFYSNGRHKRGDYTRGTTPSVFTDVIYKGSETHAQDAPQHGTSC